MDVAEMRRHLSQLRVRVSQIDFWLTQTYSMIHDIEEKLCDIKDKELEELFR